MFLFKFLKIKSTYELFEHFKIKILGFEQIVDVGTTCANSTTLLIYLLHLHTRIQRFKLRKETWAWEKACINSIWRPQKPNTLMKKKYKTQS